MYWVVTFSVIYIFTPFLKDSTSILNGISDGTINNVSYYALLGLISFITSNIWFLFKTEIPQINITKNSVIDYQLTKKILFISIIASFILLIGAVGVNGIGLILTSGSRELWLFQTDNSLITTLAELSFFYVAILSSLLLLTANTSSEKKKAFILFLVIIGLISILAFARRHVVYPILAVIFYKLATSTKKVKVIVYSLFIAPIGFLIMFLMGYFRTFGVKNTKLETMIDYFRYGNFMDIFFSNTDFAAAYYFLSQQIDYGNIFVGPLGYFKLLFTLIPRSIWSDKPQYTSVEILSILESEKVNAGFSAGTGYIGEAYGSLGILGIVLVSLIWGFVCGVLDKKFFNYQKNKILKLNNDRNFTFFEYYYIYFAILLITESHRGDFGAASIHFVLEIVLVGILMYIISNGYKTKLSNDLEFRFSKGLSKRKYF